MSQSSDALYRAQFVRCSRANARKMISRGEVSISELVLNPPEELTNMPLFELMMAQHQWGRKRVLNFLARNNLSERLGLQTMTTRQRKIFADAITRFTWSPEGRSDQTQ